MTWTCAARIAVTSTLIAANAALTCARADIITDWNVIALNASAIPPNSVLQSRTLAIVHAAIYDVVNVVERKGAPYAVELELPPGVLLDAAIAAAAHGTLTRLAPLQRPMLDAALTASLSNIPDGPSRAAGLALGSKIAEQILALRSDDGFNAKVEFSLRSGPGLYRLTPQSGPAILVHWGNVKPFVLRTFEGLEFRGPPAFDTEEFAREFNEILHFGARNSVMRTADQTAAAIFWVAQTAVPWHAAARAASAAKGLSVSENARLFALLALATADSQIVAMREKYSRPHWRPVTAIRAAAELNLPRLQAVADWEPLLVTPPHPDYPSAHAMFSGAAEVVLKTYFASDAVKVSVTFPAPFGLTRSYQTFSAITEEVEHARMWGGIHFRSANLDGSEMGRRIGTIVVRDFPKPRTN